MGNSNACAVAMHTFTASAMRRLLSRSWVRASDHTCSFASSSFVIRPDKRACEPATLRVHTHTLLVPGHAPHSTTPLVSCTTKPQTSHLFLSDHLDMA